MAQRLSEMGEIAASVLEAIPSPLFVVDRDVEILGFNRAASRMLGREPELVIRRRAGEILHCVHSTEVREGCGRAPFCADCLVRGAVNASWGGEAVVRRRARMELVSGGNITPVYLLVTTAPFAYQNEFLVMLILEDISELMELRGIVPICYHCKRIRNDQEYWESVEKYFQEHLDIDFSHSLCPECAAQLYPDFLEKPEEGPA